MRRKDRSITDKKTIEEFLSRCRTCRLAMTDGTEPYIVPVNFGYSDDTVFIHGAGEGKKMDWIRRNPRVCLEWDEEGETQTHEQEGCKWSMDYFSVIAWGDARILEAPEERRRGLDVIMCQFTQRKDWEYSPEVMEQTAVIEVRINKMTAKKKG